MKKSMTYKIETTLEVGGLRDDNEVIRQYPFVNNIQKGDYEDSDVCYNYALNTDEDIGRYGAFKIIQDRFIQIPIKKAQQGDLIVYHDEREGDSYVEHFAIIQKVNKTLESIIIRSKWGCLGVYETDIFSVPNIYGNRITIWREVNEIS